MDQRIVLEGIKKAFCEKAGISYSCPVLCFYSADNDQFILKGQKNFFWGKVFYELDSVPDADELCREYDELRQVLREEIPPVYFLPASSSAVIAGFENVPAKAMVFRYAASMTVDGIAIRLCSRQVKVPLPLRRERVMPETLLGDGGLSGRDKYSFFKQGLLSRDELLELLEMSLDLTRIRSVTSSIP